MSLFGFVGIALGTLVLLFAGSLWLLPRLFARQLVRIRKVLPGDPVYGTRLRHPLAEGLQYTEAKVPARGGVKLHAWLVWNEKVSPNGHTVLLFHGMHMSKRLFLPLATEFCSRGFQVFMPDLRAHGESEGAYCSFGLEEKYDVQHMIDWLAEHRGVQQVALLGISLGGIIGLQAAALDPRIRVMAIQSPYTSLDAIVRIRARKLAPLLRSLYHQRLRSIVQQRIGVDMRQVDLVRAAGQLQIPVLFIAGSKDPEVPADETRRVYQASSGPKVLWEVFGAYHNNIHRVAGMQYWEDISAFFLRHLEAAPTTTPTRP